MRDASSSESANPPRPEPRTRPMRGRSGVRKRICWAADLASAYVSGIRIIFFSRAVVRRSRIVFRTLPGSTPVSTAGGLVHYPPGIAHIAAKLFPWLRRPQRTARRLEIRLWFAPTNFPREENCAPGSGEPWFSDPHRSIPESRRRANTHASCRSERHLRRRSQEPRELHTSYKPKADDRRRKLPGSNRSKSD